MSKFSQEDLRALLEYISSNPAIPFPSLTKDERKQLIKKVMEQFEEEKHSAENPKLLIELVKDTAKSLKLSD